MSIQLDHTIVAANDKQTAAEFLATILGVDVGAPHGPFLPVEVNNGVKLDFMDSAEENITPQHYAFLVTGNDFDAIFVLVDGTVCPTWDWGHVPDLYSAKVGFPGINLQIAAPSTVR